MLSNTDKTGYSVFDPSFTGLARSIESHKLVYIKEGKYYTKFTGKAMYKGKEYKVVKGRVVK